MLHSSRICVGFRGASIILALLRALSLALFDSVYGLTSLLQRGLCVPAQIVSLLSFRSELPTYLAQGLLLTLSASFYLTSMRPLTGIS